MLWQPCNLQFMKHKVILTWLHLSGKRHLLKNLFSDSNCEKMAKQSQNSINKMRHNIRNWLTLLYHYLYPSITTCFLGAKFAKQAKTIVHNATSLSGPGILDHGNHKIVKLSRIRLSYRRNYKKLILQISSVWELNCLGDQSDVGIQTFASLVFVVFAIFRIQILYYPGMFPTLWCSWIPIAKKKAATF